MPCRERATWAILYDENAVASCSQHLGDLIGTHYPAAEALDSGLAVARIRPDQVEVDCSHLSTEERDEIRRARDQILAGVNRLHGAKP